MNLSDIPLIAFVATAVVFFFGFFVLLASRYKRCPSDRILVVYGRVGGGKSAICHHGGAAFILPVFQDFQFLDLTPIPIDIKLEGALSKQTSASTHRPHSWSASRPNPA